MSENEFTDKELSEWKDNISKRETAVDCSSTPENIAETNELESLRSMREEIQQLISNFKPLMFGSVNASIFYLETEKLVKIIDNVVSPQP